jgi:hypothetical protein
LCFVITRSVGWLLQHLLILLLGIVSYSRVSSSPSNLLHRPNFLKISVSPYNSTHAHTGWFISWVSQIVDLYAYLIGDCFFFFSSTSKVATINLYMLERSDISCHLPNILASSFSPPPRQHICSCIQDTKTGPSARDVDRSRH